MVCTCDCWMAQMTPFSVKGELQIPDLYCSPAEACSYSPLSCYAYDPQGRSQQDSCMYAWLLSSRWRVVTAGSYSKRWSYWLVWPRAQDQDSVQWVARHHVHSAVAPGSRLLGQEYRPGGCQIDCFMRVWNHCLVVRCCADHGGLLALDL